MSATVMPLQILAVGEVREFKNDGRVARVRSLQCFTGDVVGEIRHYEREGEAVPQAGHYMAELGWSNYQGRLVPRVSNLVPRTNVGAAKPAEVPKQ